MTHFYSLVINLTAQHEGPLPVSHGQFVQAAFMALVRAAQPELAQALHDLSDHKPYTLSTLHGWLERRDGRYVLPAGWRGHFRLTLLHTSLFNVFMQRLLTEPRMAIRLGQADFVVDSVYGAPGSHPWCGYATAESLQAEAGLAQRVRLEFATPTSFNQTDKADSGAARVALLPDPRLIWSSLSAKWQRFTSLPLPDGLQAWVERNVVVSEVRRWETRALRYKGGDLLGGLGDVTFQALHDDPAMLRAWNLLADFAFFCGVGRKTGIGMGQCRRLE